MSTAAPPARLGQLPPIKRLGFDDGWACFGPTFLNFGYPSIFVDACFTPGYDRLGFEPFGSRAPLSPLPGVEVHVHVLGACVSLLPTSDAIPAASHYFALSEAGALRAACGLVVLVGDSWDLELSWSALWRCQVGLALLRQPTSPAR